MATYLIFSDDWGRHPSSCQHLTQFLLREENRLLWVNTIGTRPPRLDWITMKRGFEKLTSWCFRPKRYSNASIQAPQSPSTSEGTPATAATALEMSNAGTAGNEDAVGASPAESSSPDTGESRGASFDCHQPKVLQPFMWPWFRHRPDRWLNRVLLRRALRKALKGAEHPIIGITTLPIVADVMRVLPQVDKWVYYCVDDWSLWPGMDAAPLEKMETEVVAQADTIITAGVALQKRILQRMGRKSTLVTHGVDLAFWRGEIPASKLEEPAELPTPQETQHPIFMFWGLIDERLDIDMVRQLSEDISADAHDISECGSIVFVGPEASQSVKSELLDIPHVEYWGVFPYAQLPFLAKRADVLIMPYYDMKVTRQMQPLKLTEYLATGKPAIVRELPATEAWKDALDVVATVEDFSRLARLRAKTGLPEEQRLARQRLENETWAAKAALFEKTIQD